MEIISSGVKNKVIIFVKKKKGEDVMEKGMEKIGYNE
jgi:hypothetical protein